MSIRVTVAYSPVARVVQERVLELAVSGTVMQAISASDVLKLFPELDPSSIAVGVWGRKVGLNHTLRDNDRVEIYRSLAVDPKVARRERFEKQGARTAGLFAKQRADAKNGY